MAEYDFEAGVIYSAANILASHGDVVAAGDLLNSVPLLPTHPAVKTCAEHDVAILREMLKSWRTAPRGV